MKRLEDLRSALSFHIVVSLKKANQEQSASTDQKLAALQDDVRTIVHMFEDPSGNLQQIAAQHSDVVEWCVSLSSEGAKPSDVADQYDEEFPKEFEGLLGSQKENLSSLNFTPQRLAMMRKRRSILDLLQFREIDDRFDEVDQAYKQTFEWIFETPVSSESLPWDDFSQFLRDPAATKPYWINGKAGSGKSTLMKYIYCDPRMREALTTWAGAKELQVAQFFSWNLGSTMQKSYLGVLQTVLYNILVRRQGLIQQVFPELWHNTHSDTLKPLSNTEVKRAFTRLVNLPDQSLRTCLFIDGIDEFDEDHHELASFIKGLAAPNLKLVISSRPIPACTEVFDDCPTLRLQDLTYKDIETYINGKLQHDANMLLIVEDEPEIAEELVREVIDMASGVFLWVKLAVSSLLSGLRDGDQISDLQERLRALPPDLENLFKHMLSKMDPMHQRQASELFQIVRQWLEMANGRPLTALAMSFANKDPTSCLQARMHSLEATKALKQVRLLQKRLRSRCCGLVETHVKAGSAKSLRMLVSADVLSVADMNVVNSHIQYLHRTVAEYLHRDDVWKDFLSLTPPNSFNVFKHISHMSLHMMKNTPLKRDPRTNKSLWYWAETLISCERSVEQLEGLARVDVLEAFDMAMTYHWTHKPNDGKPTKKEAGDAFLVEAELEYVETSHWSTHISCRLNPECQPRNFQFGWHIRSFFQLAVCAGLHEYVDSQLERHGPTMRSEFEQAELLLQAAFLQPKSPWGSSSEQQMYMVIILLRYGADPNVPIIGSSSFWTILLGHLLGIDDDSSRLIWLQIMKYCLFRGANPNATAVYNGFSYSALQIVRLGAPQVCEEPDVSRTRMKRPQDDAKEGKRAKDAKAVRELSEEIASILIHKGAREIDGEEGLWQLQHFFEDSETLSTLPPSQDWVLSPDECTKRPPAESLLDWSDRDLESDSSDED
jgi:hypothetical protein